MKTRIQLIWSTERVNRVILTTRFYNISCRCFKTIFSRHVLVIGRFVSELHVVAMCAIEPQFDLSEYSFLRRFLYSKFRLHYRRTFPGTMHHKFGRTSFALWRFFSSFTRFLSSRFHHTQFIAFSDISRPKTHHFHKSFPLLTTDCCIYRIAFTGLIGTIPRIWSCTQ